MKRQATIKRISKETEKLLEIIPKERRVSKILFLKDILK